MKDIKEYFDNENISKTDLDRRIRDLAERLDGFLDDCKDNQISYRWALHEILITYLQNKWDYDVHGSIDPKYNLKMKDV